MFKTLNLLRALFAAAFLLFIGNGLMLSSNALLLREQGFSDFAIGNVGAAIYFGALLSTLTASRLIYKVGHIRSYGFFISVYAIASLAHIYAQNIFLIAALRAVLGYCYYALLAIIESWINTKARNHNRSQILAVYEVIFYCGFCLGTLIIATKPAASEIFTFAAFALLAAALPLNLLKIKQPELSARRRERMKFPDVFSVSPLALIAALIGGFCINGYYAMSGVYFLSREFSPEQASYFISATMLGGFLAQALIGRISDHFGRKLAILGCSILGLCAVVFMYFSANFAQMCAACVLFGAGVFCIYALALARASDRVKDPKALLEVGRTLLFAYSLSAVASPFVLGSLQHFFGAQAFVATYCAALLALICYAFTQPKIDPENRAEFERRPGLFAALKKHE